VTGTIEILESLDLPANAKVLEVLRGNAPKAPLETPVETADTWQLGTHPDLVEYLWQTLGDTLPKPCARVAYAQPVLAAPGTSTIFAFAGGTGTLAMRLPQSALGEALRIDGFGKTLSYPSAVLHASALGSGWAFVAPFGADALRWCKEAYEAAAS
tara:strand:- start:27438 stop:27905 length:468 start_codon:yes stop_codon:yes gene_type:complete